MAADWPSIYGTLERSIASLRGDKPQEPKPMATAQIKSLANLVREAAANIRGDVEKIGEEFKSGVQRVRGVLDVAQNLKTEYNKVADELEQALGLHGNNPPQ